MLAKNKQQTLIGTFTVWIETQSNPCLTFFSFIPELNKANQQTSTAGNRKNKIPLCSKKQNILNIVEKAELPENCL